MRIDEVIVNKDVNEAPVGYAQRAMNFAQSKIGTAGSRAKGQGKRDVANLANGMNVDIQKLVGQTGADDIQSQQFKDLLQTYFKEKGYKPAVVTKAMKDYDTLISKGQGKPMSFKLMGGKGGIFDKFLLKFAQQAMVDGVPTKAADLNGDGKPDIGGGAGGGEGGGSTPGSPEAQAIAAVDKLADSQKQAIIQHLTGGQPKTA
jgi:hypothetical protein